MYFVVSPFVTTINRFSSGNGERYSFKTISFPFSLSGAAPKISAYISVGHNVPLIRMVACAFANIGSLTTDGSSSLKKMVGLSCCATEKIRKHFSSVCQLSKKSAIVRIFLCSVSFSARYLVFLVFFAPLSKPSAMCRSESMNSA